MFDAVYSTYVNSQDANVRIRCLSALSASPDENAIKQLLEWVLKDSTNRELLVLWTPLAGNGRASILVEFFTEHVGQVRHLHNEVSNIQHQIWLTHTHQLIQEAPMMLKYYVVVSPEFLVSSPKLISCLCSKPSAHLIPIRTTMPRLPVSRGKIRACTTWA
jgi:hypothetical protein